MAELTFANPVYLWTLILIPFIVATHLFTLKHVKTAALKFSNFEAIERVSKGEFLGKPYRGLFRNKNLFLLFLRVIVYTLIIFSVAGTTMWYTGKAGDLDFVLAIDASSSMLADDFSPNRLEAAKEAANSFVDSAPPKSMIGVVSFASAIFVEKEPTSKLEEVKTAIGSISFKESGGTNIGDTIVNSATLLENRKSSDDNRMKAIVLITDGQSNVGVPLDIAIDYAKSKQVAVYPIGVGTEEGAKFLGTNITSKLDEESLKKIAEQTEGRYFKADNKERLITAFKDIASYSEKTLSFDISWILLITALVLLAIEWLLMYTLYKTIP